jgi:hypothetical protein
MRELFYPYVRDRDPKVDHNKLARFYEEVTKYWTTQLIEIIRYLMICIAMVYLPVYRCLPLLLTPLQIWKALPLKLSPAAFLFLPLAGQGQSGIIFAYSMDATGGHLVGWLTTCDVNATLSRVSLTVRDKACGPPEAGLVIRRRRSEFRTNGQYRN